MWLSSIRQGTFSTPRESYRQFRK